ncbi:MAG: hypothetical protein HYY84_14355 [Deltaproteobacteria bacterium]|nr:hypothetical protein [Deltaproteobacteria bacterium]
MDRELLDVLRVFFDADRLFLDAEANNLPVGRDFVEAQHVSDLAELSGARFRPILLKGRDLVFDAR